MTNEPSDDEIMNLALRAADDMDATRFSEMRNGKWIATTIFEGDAGLLRFGRAAFAAGAASVPREPTQAMLQAFTNTWPDGNHTDDEITEAWQAMYDAATGEGK